MTEMNVRDPAGTVFKSTNLWSNGKIPDNRYNSDMDNAEFISKDEYIKLGGTL